MNKLAIFVEGQTELIFITKLIEEIAGKKNVIIDKTEARGGKRKARIITSLINS